MEELQHTIGVILINTGSPGSPEPRDIKPYLIEFLSDRNIIRLPRAIWLPILHGIIARSRPKKTSSRYQRIWTDEGSPLLVGSFAQRDALNERFKQEGLPIITEVGMRYGNPSIEQALLRLRERGCTHIIGFPLFPQTAKCTVGTCAEKFETVMNEASNGARRIHREPSDKASKQRDGELTSSTIKGYADNPLYWRALANSINETWKWREGSKVMFSFHSIPLSDVEAGDTYIQEVQDSSSHVAELLGLRPDDWAIAYHSRFEDSRAWATPHPKTVLSNWAQEGVERIAFVTPGFATDCLESLYDIAIVAKEHFEKHCREHGNVPEVTYIPALNDRADHISLLFNEIMHDKRTSGFKIKRCRELKTIRSIRASASSQDPTSDRFPEPR